MKSDENTFVLLENDVDSRITPVSDEGTSNPRSEETFSIFGDASCGEPLFAQHIVIDFTPQEDVDTDFVQKKVCSFWDFIASNPEISHLRVEPEAPTFSRSDFGVSVAPEPISDTVLEEAEKLTDLEKESKAVSMLKFAEEKGLIDRIFETDRAESACSLGSREYKEEVVVFNAQPKKKDRKKCKTVCTCTRDYVCNACSGAGVSAAVKSHNRKLNRDLHDWSLKHPKSMEPPGHPPSSSHTMLQRRVLQ